MSKSLVLLPLISLVFLGTVVFAQDSPFGNLADEEKTDRTVFSTENLTLEDYLSVKSNYENLVELHERAFGTRKTELAKQMTARAKDVLVSKIGAAQTFFVGLLENVKETKRLSEISITLLEDVSKSFEELVPDYLIQIEKEEATLDDLVETSEQLNDSILASLEGVSDQISILAVARGQFLIELIDQKAPIILAHLNASADLGGNTEGVQDDYNAAMLKMEKARDGYNQIAESIGDGSSFDTRDRDQLLNRVSGANKDMRAAYDGLENVLSDLRILYSQSPWEIDKTEFELKEES